jgi:hypothetical protein
MGIKINSVAGGSCGSIVPEQRGAASASDPCDLLLYWRNAKTSHFKLQKNQFYFGVFFPVPYVIFLSIL